MNTDSKTVTCGICFKTLVKPVTFKCLHSFCADCVQKQLAANKDGGFCCPVCAAAFPAVNKESLSQYSDKSLESYIAGLSNGKYGKPTCQWCEEAPSTVQCAECMCTYCEGCCESAHKRVAKRNHVIAKLNDTCRSFYHRCHQYAHEEYRAEFYCEQCGEVCCAYCLQVGPHKGHQGTNVAKAAAEARQRMAKDMVWLTQSKAKLETQTGELNLVTAGYTESYDDVEARLTDRFTLFRHQLAQRELEVRRLLAKLRDSGDGALTAARQQYLRQLNAVNEALLRFRCLQSGGADYEVLQSKAILDSCMHAELPTIAGTGFSLVTAGNVDVAVPVVQLDLRNGDLLRFGDSSSLPGGEETAQPRAMFFAAPPLPRREAMDAAQNGDALAQPLRLTFPVDEDMEATVRPDGVFLRCIARGGGGVQIGVRSKEMLESLARVHPEDGGVVSWQVRLESVSDTFLGIVEKTSRAVVPEGFYWKPACAGVIDGHLGKPTSVATRLPVCRSGDVIRFVYDSNISTLSIVVNDRRDCSVILTDLHPKVAACFIFYPGESLTVLF